MGRLNAGQLDAATLARLVEALECDVAELRRSNAELVEFASIAAHELRSPLQTIVGFAELLANHAGPSLDQEATDYLEGILRNTARLHELVEGLLCYARIGTTVRSRQDVDCAEVLAVTCQALSVTIADTGAEVTSGPLPTVVGDPAEVATVFQNLLSNAIKFGRTSVVPQIHVSAVQESGMWRFRMVDNGQGIEPEHYERVFRVFQRPSRDHGGTGIGLSICKRIIEGHGGVIWVEGGADGGTAICFTLPIPVCWSPF